MSANLPSHNTMIEPILIDAAAAAKLLGIGRTLFYSLHREAKLPAPVQLGRRVLWNRADLQAWADAGCPTRSEWEQSRN